MSYKRGDQQRASHRVRRIWDYLVPEPGAAEDGLFLKWVNASKAYSWAAAGGGGGAGGRELITEVVLASDQNFIEISAIPSTFNHLEIEYELQASHTANSSADLNVGNGTIDTGANYRWYSFGGAPAGSTSDTKAQIARARVPRADEAWARALGHYYIYRYTVAADKYMAGSGVTHGSAATQGHDWGMWTGTAVIDVLRLTSDVPPFKTGSRVRLWGITE